MKTPLLRPIIAVMLIIFGILLGVGGLFAYQEYNNGTSSTSYEECIKEKGSVIQESYPAACITRRGIRFVQPIDEVMPPEPTGKDTMPVQEFRCPPSEWVDCMPGPNEGIKLECTDEYLRWAKANCPNFEGAAY